jgi:glucose/arabinose dehydrogenase
MRPIRLAKAFCLLITLLAAPAAAQLRTQVVAQGLSAPLAFVPDPTSTTRFFIVEQGGLIRVLDNGALLPAPLLDLRSSISLRGGEQGLLGMAFAPDAATSGRFFVNFTDRSWNTVVARFQRSPVTALTASPATRFDLRWPNGARFITQPYDNHNGGHLAFGPDGYLYIGLGDGGGGNDPDNQSQRSDSLLGKMLRIDVNVSDAHPAGYVIPPGNPFLDGLPVPALGEIWSFGLRNPWRYSFDDFGPGATGALIIGDVGQRAREEVDYEPAGAGGRNYGWSMREGWIATPGVDPNRQPAFLPLTNPLFDYERSIGHAVTGGFVYRGQQLPAAYRGRYFVADAITSVVGSVGINVNPATGEATFVDAVDHTSELGGSIGGPVSFGRDRDGELYLVASFSGRILKIVSADVPGVPTGLDADVAGRDVALSWTPPAGGVEPTGYRLEAGSTPGASDIARLDTGLSPALGVPNVPDGTYFVRVRALRNGAVGPPSNEVQVAIAGCPVPAAPTNFMRSGTGNPVVLTWTPAAGAHQYVVQAGMTPQAVVSINTGAATTLTVAAPNGTYLAQVRGLNGCGVGPPSNVLQVQVP